MPLPFAGAATPLSDADFAAAAVRLGCGVAAVRAVDAVETGGSGGFLSDGSGRPRILFEAAKFSAATGHRFDGLYPGISVAMNDWKLYRGGAAEYVRLDQAVGLDRTAALCSTSWGRFQCMGFNFAMVGYASVEALVRAMSASEGNQLDCFVRFVEANRLAPLLASLDWVGFARRYNGPSYAENCYDTKLALAYTRACMRSAQAVGQPPAVPGDLGIGASGGEVLRLQRRLLQLGFNAGVADGAFGRATEFALRRFQSMRGLTPDGVAGPATTRALYLGVPA